MKDAKLKLSADSLECGISVWKNKDGTSRYELTECPISILNRETVAVMMAIDWQSLGAPPFDYEQIGYALWRKVSALHSEAHFFSNNIENDDGK